MASGADVQAWIEERPNANLGLRTPETVLGLDVDAYDGKPGLATMLAAVDRLGGLPQTVRSTSRPDDDVSGIRFYRVPPGRCWADILGPGVEVIHHGHRYAVAWPSVHPEGRVYRWYGLDGQLLTEPPAVADLPPLPQSWVDDLDAGTVADRAGKADITSADVREWLAELPSGKPCPYVLRLVDEAAAELAAAVSRHDVVRPFVGRLVRAGEQGHYGAAVGLDTLHSLFLAALGNGKPRPEDRGEWARLVTGAVALVVKEPTSVFDKGCCGIEPAAAEPPPTGDQSTDEAEMRTLDQAAAFAREVELEAYKIRVREAARGKVAAEESAAEIMPPFDDGLLVDILGRPDDPPGRVEGLIPSDGGTLVVAQRKTGKTTFQLNLARSLILGGDFLGRFPVRPVTGRIGLLNFEVSAAQLARWADEAGVPRDRLYLVNLRGRRNPFSNASDRERLADRLRAYEVESLILDPFGRAYHGKSQNDPGEVGAWLAELDRFARGEAGVCDVILAAHAGWDGERTRGASALEDWADVVVTLVRDRDDDQLRYLRAEGRDVLVEEDRLDFDAATRTLTLTGAGSRKVSAKTRHLDELLEAVVRVARRAPGITGSKLGPELRDDGCAFQKGDERKAAHLAVERGLLRVEDGPRNAKRYFDPTYPHLPRPTPPGQVTTYPDPTYRGGVGQPGTSEADLPRDTQDENSGQSGAEPIWDPLRLTAHPSSAHNNDLAEAKNPAHSTPDPELDQAVTHCAEPSRCDQLFDDATEIPAGCPSCRVPLDQPPATGCGCADLHDEVA